MIECFSFGEREAVSELSSPRLLRLRALIEYQLSLVSSFTLDKLLKRFVPQFFLLQNGYSRVVVRMKRISKFKPCGIVSNMLWVEVETFKSFIFMVNSPFYIYIHSPTKYPVQLVICNSFCLCLSGRNIEDRGQMACKCDR